MLRSRLIAVSRALLAGCVGFLVSACVGPTASTLVNLEISEAGAYTVNGQAVAAGALSEALSAKRESGKRLFVYVKPSAKSKYEAVEAALKAVRESGASIGMVGNEQF